MYIFTRFTCYPVISDVASVLTHLFPTSNIKCIHLKDTDVFFLFSISTNFLGPAFPFLFSSQITMVNLSFVQKWLLLQLSYHNRRLCIFIFEEQYISFLKESGACDKENWTWVQKPGVILLTLHSDMSLHLSFSICLLVERGVSFLSFQVLVTIITNMPTHKSMILN